jgi:hypothetical protein
MNNQASGETTMNNRTDTTNTTTIAKEKKQILGIVASIYSPLVLIIGLGAAASW